MRKRRPSELIRHKVERSPVVRRHRNQPQDPPVKYSEIIPLKLVWNCGWKFQTRRASRLSPFASQPRPTSKAASVGGSLFRLGT